MSGDIGDTELLFKDSRGSVSNVPKKKDASVGERVEILKQKPWLVSVGLVGVLMVMGGIVSFMTMNDSLSGEGVEIMSVDELTEGEGEIYVDVGGAVIKPGMYQLEGGARVNDGLVVAGGLAGSADRDWVSKNLNLAMKLVDGQKLYIPQENEVISNGQGQTLSGLININSASVAELDRLWGVGEATAKKIIDGRPYGSVEELLTKKVVKTNVYEAIKDEVGVY